jgi:hypothetical protein
LSRRIVDAVTGGQVDLAAEHRAGVVAADRGAAAVGVVIIAFTADDVSVGVGAHDGPDTIGVARRYAVAQGDAPRPVALAGRELVGASKDVLSALEQIGIAGQDRFAGAPGLEDHVHHDGIALHVDAGGAAADQFDALDLTGGRAREHIGTGVVLGRGAGVVDQDIADRPPRSRGCRSRR